MTSAAVTADRAARAERVTVPRVLISEWIRFRSLRSSWITLAVTVVFVVGLGALFSYGRASHWPPRDPGEAFTFDPTLTSLAGSFLAQLAIGVLGVLVVTGEYATGMIRATFTAVPRRIEVLCARAAVFGAATFAALLPTAFVAFLLGQQLLSSKGIETTLGSPGVTRAVVGAALYLTAIGLFGVAFGWLIRHTAGAIASLFGILLILPILVHFLPSSWSDAISKWLPSNAGQAVFMVRQQVHSLEPWPGFAVLCGYVVAALVVAAVLLRRRDA